ncbi:GTP cyclohydrolase I FolE [candidate division WOR-3 bacterium]|nr:GTP cyclohydrolase I FolE [candidate division WOR-3 bacterium]MCK4527869.1 GTP cyclohydrolase I FolE [candidate division WOR-3 bacterium]
MDQKRIKKAVREIIEALGEDPSREGLKKTPERVSRMYSDILKGIGKNPEKSIKVYHAANYDEIIIIKDIPFYSFCEHHFLPFFGKVHIAYIPKDDRITGYANLVEVVDVYSQRLQLQERMTAEIADTIMKILKPMGTFVIIEARQLCLEMQGLKKQGERTVTSAIRGAFERERTRLEALSLMER